MHKVETTFELPLYDDEATWQRLLVEQGPDHPDTLAARVELAISQAGDGRVEEAVHHLEGAWRGLRALRGPTHPWTLEVARRLAGLWLLGGRTGRALELYDILLGVDGDTEELRALRARVASDLVQVRLDRGELYRARAVFRLHLAPLLLGPPGPGRRLAAEVEARLAAAGPLMRALRWLGLAEEG